jgi:hypothetical protein
VSKREVKSNLTNDGFYVMAGTNHTQRAWRLFELLVGCAEYGRTVARLKYPGRRESVRGTGTIVSRN